MNAQLLIIEKVVGFCLFDALTIIEKPALASKLTPQACVSLIQISYPLYIRCRHRCPYCNNLHGSGLHNNAPHI